MSGLSRRRLLQGALVAGAAAAIPRTAQAREPVSPEPGAVGMLYDSTRCLDCGACVAACKEANGLPYRDEPHELDCETKSVVKTRHLSRPAAGGAASAFVKRQCMHCVDPSCVSVCVLGALHKEGRGKRDSGGERAGSGIVLYDPTLCLGCRYCQIACAYSVPKFQWFEAVPRIVKCELCRGRADPAPARWPTLPAPRSARPRRWSMAGAPTYWPRPGAASPPSRSATTPRSSASVTAAAPRCSTWPVPG